MYHYMAVDFQQGSVPLHHNIYEKIITQLKSGRWSWIIIFQQEYEKLFNMNHHWGSIDENHNEASPTGRSMISKTRTNSWHGVEKRQTLYTVNGDVTWHNYWGDQWGAP